MLGNPFPYARKTTSGERLVLKLLLSLFLALAALYFGVKSLGEIYGGFKSYFYEHSVGRINNIQPIKGYSRTGSYVRGICLEYSFKDQHGQIVLGHHYSSESRCLDYPLFGALSSELKSKYQAGKEINVYYSQSNPEDSYLLYGIQGWSLVKLLAAFLFYLLAQYFFQQSRGPWSSPLRLG